MTLTIGMMLAVMPAQAQVDVDVAGDQMPGGTVTATVTTTDGSTINSVSWSQTGGAEATLSGTDSATVTAVLADAATYKAALIHALSEPPIGPDQLPPNIEFPEGEFPGGLQDRFTVVGINPLALEHGSAIELEAEVSTSSGDYTVHAEIVVDLGYDWTYGIRNVPTNVVVLLQGKEQSAYDWALTGPGGSAATLADADTQNPEFTPDVPGRYTITVTDEATGEPVEIAMYAGTYVGAITGQDGDGNPVADDCTVCHNGALAPDMFTDWAKSGHAEILQQNLAVPAANSHYSSNCFPCHSVGYDTGADNGGFDEATGYGTWYDTYFPDGHPATDENSWTETLASFPAVAQLANIQCENCHGPGDFSGAHGKVPDAPMDSFRISASANVCGFCHGEPPRHARFQQWEESGHGNFETAIAEGTNGSCAKCHTAQGFLQWFEEGDLTSDPDYEVTPVDEGLTQPITCAVCHDPHDVGTVSGDGNNVMMRVDGDSPPLLGGFTAYGIGHGAQCIVCHNTRRGQANDDVGLPDPVRFDRAPHGGAQGDILMGQNAFFVDVGMRGGHSYITDTCSTCHMEITDPPPDLSYNLSGTNHTFEADTSICSECHGLFDADSLIELNDSTLEALAGAIEYAIEQEILFHTVTNLDTLTVSGEVGGIATDVDITAASTINSIELTESHGRAAMNIDVDGTLVEHVQLSSGTALLSTGETLLDNTVHADEGLNLAKVCWNYFMIHNDSSHGIHNPGFVDSIFVATFDVIDTIWP